MSAHCREYVEWMEKLAGVTKGKGKRKRFLLFNCIDEKGGCRGCIDSDTCDSCGVGVCNYLAKIVDDYLLCPECWESGGCMQDDRMKEEEKEIVTNGLGILAKIIARKVADKDSNFKEENEDV